MSHNDRKKWNKEEKYDFDFEYPDLDYKEGISTERQHQKHQEITKHTSKQFIETSNEIRKRYENYLLNLHVKNKIRKLVNEKDSRDKELNSLEDGFNLYVNGAHKTPEKHTPRHLVAATKIQKNVPKLDLNYVLSFDKSSNEATERDKRKSGTHTRRRKQWGDSSVIIKTMDGCKIKLSSKHNYNSDSNEVDSLEFNENYSDDFDSDSNDDDDDDKIKKCNKQKQSGLMENVKFLDSNPSESDADNDDVCDVSVQYDRKTFEEKFLNGSNSIDDLVKSIQKNNELNESADYNNGQIVRNDMKILTVSQLISSSDEMVIDAFDLQPTKSKPIYSTKHY